MGSGHWCLFQNTSHMGFSPSCSLCQAGWASSQQRLLRAPRWSCGCLSEKSWQPGQQEFFRLLPLNCNQEGETGLQLCLFQFTTALWLCVACCLRCPSEQQSWMKFICVMSCMLPCLQHSSMPSAFSSHLLQRPLRTPLEDQKFMVFYHFLNALALEIQEWSWKVSLESISINAAETTLEDFYLELHSLSSLFYRRASLSFFFLFTVNSGSKEVWQLWD